MLRTLYILLLHLHPARFKYRFGDEMLAIFDETSAKQSVLPLFTDGFRSMLRQWLLRPAPSRAPQPEAATGSGVPVFFTFEDEMPRKSALFQGAVLAVATFAAVVFAIRTGGTPGRFLIGSHHPHHSHLLTAKPEAPAEDLQTELTTEVTMPPDAAILDRDPMRGFVIAYFRAVPIVEVLDANRDLTISAGEISGASAVLRKFDSDRDGILTPAELGFDFGDTPLAPDFREHATAAFMRIHPVIAALDANHDQQITAAEIVNAGSALKRLDTNRDGRLTWREILPEPVANEVDLLFALDLDADGKVSRGERSGRFGSRFAKLFDTADSDHDGFITERELSVEIKRRADLDGDGVVTWEEMLTARRSGLLGPKR
jgi:hypothetical protein